MSETDAPPTNSPEARTETGTIKDQSPPTPTTTDSPTSPAPPPTEAPPAEKPAETKADGEKPSLLNEKKPEEPKGTKAPAGAPEKYADFKAPEGFEINKDVLDKALPTFKELGLNQDQAQKLVDFYATASKEAADAPFKLWEDTQAKWIEEVKADPEIGGKLDQVKATVSRALDGLGDAKLANDFRAAMDYTGAGNNPAFIRAFYRLATKITEGGNVAGGRPSALGQQAPGTPARSAAHTLFPNLP